MRDYASLQKQLLSDLGLDASLLNAPITSDMSIKMITSLSLAKAFYKKLCPEGNSKTADENATKKFLSINASLPEEPQGFICDNEAESCFYDFYRDNLRVSLEPSESLGTFDLDFIRSQMMVGPGAAQKANSETMVTKLFESPLSYTDPILLVWYRSALAETGYWADAEMQRFQKYGFIKVEGGKIFFAAKDAGISRTCCTEPNVNMLIQKAIGAFFEVRLEYFFGISLKRQPDLNREIARRGSIDCSMATQDLVSASDSIGLQLIKRDLPDGFLKAAILRSRCEYAVLPDGSKVKLRMVSTMGNGFTFPLQTLIFACVIKAVYQVMGFPTSGEFGFGVFGDDIALRKECYEFAIKMLTKLGFTVNVGKSFNTGLFRESCGHDYYGGVNIRGVYIRSLETPQEVNSAFNRLTRWSAIHGIELTGTLKMLLSWTRDIRVPLEEDDEAGLQVPFRASRFTLTNTYWFKYRKYMKVTKRIKVGEPDSDKPPINEYGVAVGFLSGHLRRRDIVLSEPTMSPSGLIYDSAWRHDWSISCSIRDKMGARSRYKIVTRQVPYWDYLPVSGGIVYQDPKILENNSQEVEPVPGVYFRPDEYRFPLTGESHEAWKSLVADLLE